MAISVIFVVSLSENKYDDDDDDATVSGGEYYTLHTPRHVSHVVYTVSITDLYYKYSINE